MKRFSETEKWEDPWFRKLPAQMKVFWQYLCDRCDAAGFWKEDIDYASYMIGAKINREQAVMSLEGRIHIFESKDEPIWFVKGFIEFQYGAPKENYNPHNKIFTCLGKYGLSWPISSLPQALAKGSLGSLMDKDKDKDMDKGKDKDKEEEDKNLTDLEKALNSFYAMRKSIKKPITEQGKVILSNKLELMAPSDDLKKIKILEQSIMNSWQGVFELREEKAKSKFGPQKVTNEELRDSVAQTLELMDGK